MAQEEPTATDTVPPPSTFDATGGAGVRPAAGDARRSRYTALRAGGAREAAVPARAARGTRRWRSTTFRNDTRNPDLDIALKPMTRIRPYQEKSPVEDVRQRARAERDHRAAVRRRASRSPGSPPRRGCAKVVPVSVHVLRERGPVGGAVQAVDEPHRPGDRAVHELRRRRSSRPSDRACVCVTTYNMVSRGGQAERRESRRVLAQLRGRRVGHHAAGRGARRPGGDVPQGDRHHEGALQARASPRRSCARTRRWST